MRKVFWLRLIAGLGCSGTAILVALMFAVALVISKMNDASGILNICGPANPAGPELLSPAPKPTPKTTGPSAYPAAYTVGLGSRRPGGVTVEKAALAARAPANSIPSNYVTLYKSAGAKYGIPWSLLAGVGEMESDHGRSTLAGVHSGENSAGAAGPMQFLRGTWYEYGTKNKDDRYNPELAIPAAAKYLHTLGVPGQSRRALYRYNGGSSDGSTKIAWQYADNVLAWAKRYDSSFTVDGPNNAGAACGALDNAASPLGKRIIDYAEKWLGKPYVWGGGNINGPTGGGFDCSGLTLYAVYHATGGQITLAHYTGDQLRDRRGKRVTRSQLQPGDLVFFTSAGASDPHHVGIYVGGGKMVHAPHTGTVVKVAPIVWKEFSGGVRFTATAKA